MKDYISGVIIDVEEGATYEDIVRDYWLDFKLSDQQNMKIFDYGLLSVNLSKGMTCTLALFIFSFNVLDCDLLQEGIWNGKIIQPDWEPEQYKHNNVRLTSSKGYVLVETQYGECVFDHEDLKKRLNREVKNGDVFCWTNCRVDLMGIV